MAVALKKDRLEWDGADGAIEVNGAVAAGVRGNNAVQATQGGKTERGESSYCRGWQPPLQRSQHVDDKQ